MADLSLDCPSCGTANTVPMNVSTDSFTCISCGVESTIDDAATVTTEPGEDYLVGEVIAECKVLAKVGEGGFGSVYKAFDQNLQRTVAVKVMLESLSSNIDFVQKFIREAVTAAQLNHPNIVAIHKVGRHERRGLHFLIMEFVDGETLADIVDNQGVMALSELLPIALQACDALATAHEANIVHRDIKPENLMIDGQRVVKITDFGLAKSLSSDHKTTKVMGTPHYMSPEQFEGKPVDGRSDIYSLGVTLYYLLSKERPYEGENTVQIIYSILTQEPKALVDVNADVPQALWAVIQRMIAKKAEDRYQTLRETIEDLRKLQQRSGGDRSNCPECGTKNPRSRKFCRGCGAALLVKCPACGNAESAQAAECGKCGADIGRLLKVQKALKAGKRFKALGDLRRAAEAYRQVLEIDPANSEAVAEGGQLDDTLVEVERVRTEADELMKTGEIDAALARVEELLQRVPTAGEVREHRDQLRQQSAARKVNALVEEAGQARDDGDIRRALERLDQALRVDPDRADVRAQRQELGRRVAAVTESRQRAVEALAAGRYEDAYSLACEVLQVTPSDTAMAEVRDKAQTSVASADSVVSAGRAFLERNELPEALSKFEAALSLRPGDPQLFQLVEDTRRRISQHREKLSLCRRLMADRQYGEAINGLKQVLADTPDDAEALSLFDACAKSMAAVEKAHEVEAGIARADALERTGDLTGAMEELARVADLDPRSDEARRRISALEHLVRQERDIRELANEHLLDGRYGEAVSALERLRQVNPGKSAEIDREVADAGERERRVQSSLQRAEESLARREYRRAGEAAGLVLDIAPKHPRAVAIKKDADKALTAIARFLGEADRLILSEMFDDALGSLDKARERGASGEEYAQRRAACEQGQLALLKTDATRSLVANDYEAAIAAYEQVLEVSGEDADALRGKRAAQRRIRIRTTEPLMLRLGTAAVVVLLLGLVQMTAIASTRQAQSDAQSVVNAEQEAERNVEVADVVLEPSIDDALAAEAAGDFDQALAAYQREIEFEDGRFKDRAELTRGRDFARAVLAVTDVETHAGRLDALGAAKSLVGTVPAVRAAREAAIERLSSAEIEAWFAQVEEIEFDGADGPARALDMIEAIASHPVARRSTTRLAQVKARSEYLEALDTGGFLERVERDFAGAARKYIVALGKVEGDTIREGVATERIAAIRVAWMGQLRERAAAAGDDDSVWFEVIQGLESLGRALQVGRDEVLDEFRR